MEDILGQKFRMRNEITGELEDTLYTVIMVENDNEIEDLIWLYLESEFEDENIEYEPKYNIYYSKITSNAENLLA